MNTETFLDAKTHIILEDDWMGVEERSAITNS